VADETTSREEITPFRIANQTNSWVSKIAAISRNRQPRIAAFQAIYRFRRRAVRLETQTYSGGFVVS